MKGTGVVPIKPHYIGDFEAMLVIGGITFEIFETFAHHYGISFNVTIERDWMLMNEDGTLGGMVGMVSK